MIPKTKPKRKPRTKTKPPKKVSPQTTSPVSAPQSAGTEKIPEIIISPRTGKPLIKQLGKTKRELTARARIILESLIAGLPERQALKNAGYSNGYSNCGKRDILSNTTIQKTFIQELEKAGVSDDYLATKIMRLSEAKEKKFFAHEGVVQDEREVDALGVQSGMIQFAAKLKGHLVEKTQETGELTIKVVKYSE